MTRPVGRGYAVDMATTGRQLYVAALGLAGGSFLWGLAMVMFSGLSRARRLHAQAAETSVETGKVLMLVAGVTGLVLLGAGMAYGLGMGGGLGARWLRSVRVDARLLHFGDGTTVIDGSPESHPDAKCYVRVEKDDGSVDEFLCSPEMYSVLEAGWRGDLNVAGARIVRVGLA